MAAAWPSLPSFLSFFGALEEVVDPGSADPAAASSPEDPFSFFLRPLRPSPSFGAGVGWPPASSSRALASLRRDGGTYAPAG